MSERAITFDDTGYKYQGERNGVLIWFTGKGDVLALFHYPIPPDILADLASIEEVRNFYRHLTSEAGLGVIEIETVLIDGCPAVRTIIKAAQQPNGRRYMGALTIPFRDFSYVLKTESEEVGATGGREMVVGMKLMATGEVKIDTENGRMTDWLDDPYDPDETGPMTRNKSERPEYDAEFPDHPLSRTRAILEHLQRSVVISDAVKRQPGFLGRR